MFASCLLLVDRDVDQLVFLGLADKKRDPFHKKPREADVMHTLITWTTDQKQSVRHEWTKRSRKQIKYNE